MNAVKPTLETVLAARARGRRAGESARAEARRAAARVLYAESGPLVVQLRDAGMTYFDIGEVLTQRGIFPPAGGRWWPSSVQNVYRRFAEMT